MVTGPIVSSVTTWLSLVSLTVSLFNSSGPDGAGVHISSTTDLRRHNNTELALRLETSVANTHFYTDLNSFQMSRRRTQARLPIQGNFYPMTSVAYIEDESARLSLISSHSHGVASLNPGLLEVVLDRRLSQDDWRGLREGVMDNVPSSSTFVLTLEQRSGHTAAPVPGEVSNPSLAVHQLINSLASPLILLTARAPLDPPAPPRSSGPPPSLPFSPLGPSALPCDVHLLSLRAVGGPGGNGVPGGNGSPAWNQSVLMVLHRWGVDCEVVEEGVEGRGQREGGRERDASEEGDVVLNCQRADGTVDITRLFQELPLTSERIQETVLTGVQVKQPKANVDVVTLAPMQLRTFSLSFTSD